MAPRSLPESDGHRDHGGIGGAKNKYFFLIASVDGVVLHGGLNFGKDFLTGVVPTGPRKGFEQNKHNQTDPSVHKVTGTVTKN